MPNAHLSAGKTLLRWWDAEGAGIKTRSVSAAEIEQFERRYGLTLPAPFRDYLTGACPVEDPLRAFAQSLKDTSMSLPQPLRVIAISSSSLLITRFGAGRGR